MKKLIDFFQSKIWLEQSVKYNTRIYKFLRVAIRTFQGFITDNCFEKGAALTYYTLMSLVPLLAIIFGIAQGFEVEQKISEAVKDQFQSQPEIANKIINFSQSYIKQVKGSLIASLGIIVLLWSIFSMIGNIENYFNKIWKIHKARTWWQQIKSYVLLLFLLPLFLVVSSSLTVYSTEVAAAASRLLGFSSFIFFVFKIIPYLSTWGMLSLFYFYFPNTKVLWRSSLIAGLITSLIFFIWQSIYVEFQTYATSYGAIYGSFAAIPLFLFWLNYSWLIVLFGIELSYHIQKSR